MSTNLETPASAKPPQQDEVVNTSYLRGIVETSRHVVGRAAIALGLTVGVVAAETAAIEPAVAVADTGGYPDWNATDCSAVYGIYSWCKPGDDWISPRGYGYNNCTDWAAFRIPQLTSRGVPTGLGHAETWNDRAPANWIIDNTPEPGDIAVWEDGELHRHSTMKLQLS